VSGSIGASSEFRVVEGTVVFTNVEE